jgi:hypothetical protein
MNVFAFENEVHRESSTICKDTSQGDGLGSLDNDQPMETDSDGDQAIEIDLNGGMDDNHFAGLNTRKQRQGRPSNQIRYFSGRLRTIPQPHRTTRHYDGDRGDSSLSIPSSDDRIAIFSQLAHRLSWMRSSLKYGGSCPCLGLNLQT